MNVVRVKPGVRFDPVTPGGLRILSALDLAARGAGIDLTITSGSDSHAAGDVHTLGLAYDVSVRDLTIDEILEVRQRLQAELGPGFTVLYESSQRPTDARLQVIVYLNAGATAPHLHVQVRNGWQYPPIAPPATVPV